MITGCGLGGAKGKAEELLIRRGIPEARKLSTGKGRGGKAMCGVGTAAGDSWRRDNSGASPGRVPTLIRGRLALSPLLVRLEGSRAERGAR